MSEKRRHRGHHRKPQHDHAVDGRAPAHEHDPEIHMDVNAWGRWIVIGVVILVVAGLVGLLVTLIL